MTRAPVLALAVAALAATAAADDLAVAWLRDGRIETRAGSTHARLGDAPLGSLWKLFVYTYAVDRGLETPPYRCGTPTRPGDEYCCEAGQSIARDPALARSCGLFFAPGRLGITAGDWRAFWTPRTAAGGAWLLDLAKLRPDTRLPVTEILRALDAVPATARAAASRALLPVLVEGYGKGAATHLGGTLRAKTFTWRHPARPGRSLGGGAGWLGDGTPVWFAATGASREVFREHAERLAAALPEPRGAPLDDPCVVVDYFARYPIRAVDRLPSRERADPGPLHGRHRVLFANGNALTFVSAGELRLDRDGARTLIRGRLSLSEYIARVVDREGDATAVEAARALAITARTWLLQNAPFEAGCFRVADSSRTQRVSANPPSPAARAISLFTDGLILKGLPVRYQLDTPAPGVLAWTDAVQQARDGRRFDAILALAFPKASLATVSGEAECRRLPEAETWLARMVPRWERELSAEPGFEPPPDALTVCGLDYGNPYADRARSRIHVRGLATREDRLSIAHEYVHFAFRFHPRGTDETFVERTARVLAE